jgi:RNA-binding protein
MQRKELRARAHKLDPVVIIGAKGLTDAILAEVDRALTVHELIKIKASLERSERKLAFKAICERTGAEPIQQIGKVIVLYRKNPEKP